MSISLPDIGHVATTQVDGLQIRLARGGQSGGIPILLTSPWPESITPSVGSCRRSRHWDH